MSDEEEVVAAAPAPAPEEEIKNIVEVSVRLNVPLDTENLKELIFFYGKINNFVGEQAYDYKATYALLSAELREAILEEERTAAYAARIDCMDRQCETYSRFCTEIQSILWRLERELRKTLKEKNLERKVAENDGA